MPKIEVDEEEYVRNSRLRDTVAKIWANPKTRVQLQALHKEVDPSAQTPELDAQAPVNEAISSIKKDMSEFLAEQRKEKAEREQQEKLSSLNSKISSGLAALRQAGWNDTGIKGVEEIMEKHGIVDVEIAANHYEKLHPPPPPVTPGGSGAWNFLEPPSDDDADLKQLIESKGQSMPLLDKMVRDTLADVRGQPVRR